MKAFSLVELLIVVAIIAVLMGLTIPAVQMNTAMGITQAGDLVADQIALAKQEASTKSRDVEVRIIQVNTNEPAGFGAVQLWIADELGIMKPLGRMVNLPSGVGVNASPDLSPLLGLTNGTVTNALGTMPWRGFRIRSNGLPERAVTTANNFLTVQSFRDGTNLAGNFFTLRLHPVTGRIIAYRP